MADEEEFTNVEDECMTRVLAASAEENAAIELDRAGDIKGALAKYAKCEQELLAAIRGAGASHAADVPKLEQHRKEVLDRIAHLKSLDGKPSTIPVEDQIKAVQLAMQAPAAASAAVSSAGGVKTMVGAAAIGGAAGLMVLGSTIGLGVAAIGGAAGAAYCATRQDKVGDVARKAGGLAASGADKAIELNREHKITEKVAEAGNKAVTAAKTVDNKYHITDKVSKGVGTVFTKAQEFEQQHKVTDKVASGFSKGLSKISSALDSATKRGSGSGGYTGSGAGGAASTG